MAEKNTKSIELPKGKKLADVLAQCNAEKKADFKHQARRHPQWDENYLLYRDRVQVNRLTQRQAVNIPLIKETIRTVLPKIDEEPEVTFSDKAGDLDREITVRAKWDDDFDTGNMALMDYVDKKQVCLYGRSFKKLNWSDGAFEPELKDPYDLVIDKGANPLDIETARHLEELHIFRPLHEVLSNEKYDSEGRRLLKVELGSEDNTKTITRNNTNKEMADARNKRMQQLSDGKDSGLYEDFSAYDQIIELTQHYTTLWDEEKEEYVRYVILVANETVILRAKTLKKATGVDFWPFEGWADDIEATDQWSDSIADMLRTLNQVVNIFFSQLIENRTLRNFGMNFYDSTVEGFSPQTFEARPGGWYPLPGKPGEVYQRVDIPELAGTVNDIQFLVGIAEKASATGAVDKGVVESMKRTLGEIEIAVGKANERTTSMSKFYRLSWKRYIEKWYKLYEANMAEGDTFKLYKKNPLGKLVGQEFEYEQFVSPDGMTVTVLNSNEIASDKVDKIQRLNAVQQFFPDNPPLKKAIQKRLISLADLTPEEAQEIETYEANKAMAPVMGGAPGSESIPDAAAPMVNQIDEMIAAAKTA